MWAQNSGAQNVTLEILESSFDKQNADSAAHWSSSLVGELGAGAVFEARPRLCAPTLGRPLVRILCFGDWRGSFMAF